LIRKLELEERVLHTRLESLGLSEILEEQTRLRNKLAEEHEGIAFLSADLDGLVYILSVRVCVREREREREYVCVCVVVFVCVCVCACVVWTYVHPKSRRALPFFPPILMGWCTLCVCVYVFVCVCVCVVVCL